MNRLLTVSRAARLVGVSRGTLQKKIQDGELNSFEGMVDIDELTAAYPNVEVEDTAMLEKIEQIIENALKRARGEKLRKLLAPDLSTLASRVAELSSELANSKASEQRYARLLDQTLEKLRQISTASNSTLAELLNWLQQERDKAPEVRESARLIAQDTLLRMIAAQVHLMPSGHEFFVEGNNSILESALSAGLAMNYGCSNGNCGKCKSRLISGEVKKIHDHEYELSTAEEQQGYILACSNTAVTDIVLAAEEALSIEDIPPQTIQARVDEIEHLSRDILVLQIKTPKTHRLRFLSGQKLTLTADATISETLHIASCPCNDRFLQFHVKRDPSSAFASRIFETTRINDPIRLDGPTGKFVLNQQLNLPIIFIALDTGFAPIKSLIEHAMTLDSSEQYHLFWIVCGHQTHYLHNLCRAWTDALDNFRYTPLEIESETDMNGLRNQLRQLSRLYHDLAEYQIYVAGPHKLVHATEEYVLSRQFPQQQFFSETV